MTPAMGDRPTRSDKESVSPIWALGVAAGALAVTLGTSDGPLYPAASAGALSLALGQLLFPATRPRKDPLLCPLNWALLLFLLQLVLLPIILVVAGPTQGMLPHLPSPTSINRAMALNGLAFLAFSLVYQYTAALAPHETAQSKLAWKPPVGDRIDRSRWVAAWFISLGLVGLGATFGNVENLTRYFVDPLTAAAVAFDLSGTTRGLLGLLLRPFLVVGAIMLWCRWSEDRARSARGWRRWALTGACTIVVMAVGLTYSFNRAAALVPLVAMAAAYSARVRPLRLGTLALIGAAVLTAAAVVGSYRYGDPVVGEAPAPEAARIVLQRVDPIESLQAYGGSAQYLGFVLQEGAEHRPLWGGSLVASMLYPVPRLGRAFRDASGVARYNRMVYGNTGILDQVDPFQGELFLNFGLAGVLAGIGLIGGVTQVLQRRFDKAGSALECYVWQFTAVWVLFLLIGSLAAVSQIFVYFFWPLYVIGALRFLFLFVRGDRGPHLGPVT